MDDFLSTLSPAMWIIDELSNNSTDANSPPTPDPDAIQPVQDSAATDFQDWVEVNNQNIDLTPKKNKTIILGDI
jgi:hypothetical protein